MVCSGIDDRDRIGIAVRNVESMMRLIPRKSGRMESHGNRSRHFSGDEINTGNRAARYHSALIDKHLIRIRLWPRRSRLLARIWETSSPITNISNGAVAVDRSCEWSDTCPDLP